MDERRLLLDRFEEHEFPNLWPDIEARSMRSDDGPARHGQAARRPSRLRLSLVGAVVALLAVVATAVVWPTTPRTERQRSNVRLVAFTVAEDEITARITDPLAAADQLTAAFRERGLDISVTALPVSPSLVGTIVYSDVPSIRSLHSGQCLAGGTACVVGLVIPADFEGDANVVVGRAAQANETYHSSDDVFAAGEVLHCSGILGSSVTDAVDVLRQMNLSVRWNSGDETTAPTSGFVVDGTAISPDTVLLNVEPEPLDTPEFHAFEAEVSRGC